MWIIFAVILTIITQADVKDNITGRWQCSGEQDNKKYSVNLDIIKEGNFYYLHWSQSNQLTNVGIGIVIDNNLSSAFSNGRAVGMVVYRIKPGRLEGFWVGGSNEVLRENCRRGNPA